MTKNTAPSATTIKDLHWLLRYARRGKVKLEAGQSEANALKSCFSAAAWRLLCRSERACFVPILRNRQLSFDSLVHYTQTLVNNGFQVAPDSHLLDYLIVSSYYYFDRMPKVPDGKDEMTLLHLATRQGAVSCKDFQRVHEWIVPGRGAVTTRMSWPAVLRRANLWHVREQLVVDHAKAAENCLEAKNGWHFACGDLPWRGYEIKPLVNHIDLWDEGQAMSSCLYRLRQLCGPRNTPSRYFSVRKHGHRYATLELVRDTPCSGMSGPDRIYGRWRLQDCRLSHNRLPSEDLVKKLTDFGWHYNVLSQRPSRLPKPSHSQRTGKNLPIRPTKVQDAAISEWLVDQLGHDAGDLGAGEPLESPSSGQLKVQICGVITEYETRLGPIPDWFEELDPDRVLNLLCASLRIGLRLPAEETLQLDKANQLRDRWHFRNQGLSSSDGFV